jgi:hypothetical protein
VNPIVFALRHPITTIMLVVALVSGGALALNRMRIDIFPPINQAQIRLMDQVRRLEDLAGGQVGHAGAGQLA